MIKGEETKVNSHRPSLAPARPLAYQVLRDGRLQQTPAPTGSTARFVPNDPEYRRQWHLRMIGMEEAWTKTKGKGAVVAVIDSGVGARSSSGWIQGQDFAQTKFVKGYNFADNTDDSPDDNGHGTHVAGTIAESTDNGILGAGVAPEATIMPLPLWAIRTAASAPAPWPTPSTSPPITMPTSPT